MATVNYQWESDYADYLLHCNRAIHEFEHYKVKQLTDPLDRILYSPVPRDYEHIEGADFLLEPGQHASVGYRHRAYSYHFPELVAELLQEDPAFPGANDWLLHLDCYGAPIEASSCVPAYHISGTAIDMFIEYMSEQGCAVSFNVSITNSEVDLTMRVNEDDVSVHVTAESDVRTSVLIASAHCIAIATYLKS